MLWARSKLTEHITKHSTSLGHPASFSEPNQNTRGIPRSPSLRQRAMGLNKITRATERGQISTHALSLFSSPFLPKSAARVPLASVCPSAKRRCKKTEMPQPKALWKLVFWVMNTRQRLWAPPKGILGLWQRSLFINSPSNLGRLVSCRANLGISL